MSRLAFLAATTVGFYALVAVGGVVLVLAGVTWAGMSLVMEAAR